MSPVVFDQDISEHDQYGNGPTLSDPVTNPYQTSDKLPDDQSTDGLGSQGQDSRPRKVLSLFDSICIIVGIIIGSGIFETAPRVAGNAGNTFWTISFWVFGGALALIGAMCFAELTGRFKDQVGGDYVYLKNAYGNRFGKSLAFLFAWAAFWIIRPGNIGAMAMVFSRYFNQIVPVEGIIGYDSLIPYAFMAVVLLSVTNLIGLRQGKLVQNILTVSKVIGIAAIVLIALLSPADSAKAPGPPIVTPAAGMIWLSMIFVMFTYGGWNDIAFVAGEVKEPKKNLFRSLMLGTLAVTLLYILINIAFIYGLGFDTMVQSKAVATDLVRECLGAETVFGQRSSQLISGLVCIACLGAINGMILVGPRIYYALGRDFAAFGFLARWSSRRDGPWQATLIQGIITGVLILMCLGYSDAFDVIVTVTAPYFWGFLGLTVFGLISLRMQSSSSGFSDFYRVPWFPLPPVIFGVVCFCLVYAGIDYLIFKQYQVPALVVSGFMSVGIVLSFLLKPRSTITS